MGSLEGVMADDFTFLFSCEFYQEQVFVMGQTERVQLEYETVRSKVKALDDRRSTSRSCRR